MTREEKIKNFETEIKPLESELHQVAYRSLKRNLDFVEPRDVEDIVQETMKSAWKNLYTFQGDSALKTWVYGILKNKIRDHIRNMVREKQRIISRIIISEENGGEIDILDKIESDADVIKEILRTEQLSNIMVALDRLNQSDREIIMMKYFEELSSKEAAERLGVQIGTIDVRKHRAMKRWLVEIKKLEGGDDCE